MATNIHFLDVGQGNMVLVRCSDGTNLMVDCNITEDNKSKVFDYISKQIGQAGEIYAFICTHRDADHIRGIKALHDRFHIGRIWDSGYPGTTTDSDEYKEYMRLRRDLSSAEIKKQTRDDFGYTRLRYLSAQDERLPKNANDQGIVIKVEELDAAKSGPLGSAILTGDGSYETWKNGIMKDYHAGDVSCDILMAAHHGSLDFFDDLNSCDQYEEHIKAMSPAMTVISVGDNSYGHPDATALKLYEKHCSGSSKGNKVARTDKRGTMKL